MASQTAPFPGASNTASAGRPPLWSRELVLSLLCQTFIFASYGMGLASTPLLAAAAGGSTIEIGLVTTIFSLLTIALEIQTPVLLGRFSVRTTLRASMLLLAAGTAMLFLAGSSIPLMWLAAAVRGIGFGSGVVAGLTLTSQLAPVTRRGEALALQGIAVSIPNALAPSGGIILLDHGGVGWVIGLGTAIGLLGAVCAHLLPTLPPDRLTRRPHPLAALRQGIMLSTFTAIALLSAVYGGVVTFLPLLLERDSLASGAAFLLVGNSMRTLARATLGQILDRLGPWNVAFAAMALAALGLTLMAIDRSPISVLVAAACFGIGTGAVQNAGFMIMISREHVVGHGVVSGLWNLAFDVGLASGAFVLSLASQTFGPNAIFVLFPLMPALGLAALAGGYRLRDVK